MVDGAGKRLPEDVYFKPDVTQEKLVRPPIVHVSHEEIIVPLDVLWIAGGIGLFVRWRRRRKAASARPTTS